MPEITALKYRGGKIKVYIDGTFSFTVTNEVAAKLNLAVGRCLSTDEIQVLLDTEAVERCLTAALRLLSYRPKSRAELKWRLLGRGFPESTVDKVFVLLEQKGLIDDVAFARYWIDNRARFGPRSSRFIGLELKRKGVNVEVVDAAIRSLDDEVLAYRACLKKAKSLATRFPVEESYKRLYSYLRRRGFANGVIRSVLGRLWNVFGISH